MRFGIPPRQESQRMSRLPMDERSGALRRHSFELTGGFQRFVKFSYVTHGMVKCSDKRFRNYSGSDGGGLISTETQRLSRCTWMTWKDLVIQMSECGTEG